MRSLTHEIIQSIAQVVERSTRSVWHVSDAAAIEGPEECGVWQNQQFQHLDALVNHRISCNRCRNGGFPIPTGAR